MRRPITDVVNYRLYHEFDLNLEQILEEPQYQPLEQSDVKEIIHDVLQELQARESHVEKNGNKKN